MLRWYLSSTRERGAGAQSLWAVVQTLRATLLLTRHAHHRWWWLRWTAVLWADGSSKALGALDGSTSWAKGKLRAQSS
eukprot:4207246-Amphidinium_carterae.1